jgi:aspartyl-tRNA(Asn)/glutamyl-tRNA(Gln) amidotransferase subunit C
MSDLNKDTIKKLTELCRIDCTNEEQESILQDLERILQYIELLHEVDTEGVEPCNHVLEMFNVMREDEVGELLDREVFLSNAPSHIGGMIKVPPVLKSKEKEN